MLSTINIICLVAIYAVLIILMLTYFKNNLKNNFKRDEDDDNNGGGWDAPVDEPTIDLPPGVFILPPDQPDPSLSKKYKTEQLQL